MSANFFLNLPFLFIYITACLLMYSAIVDIMARMVSNKIILAIFFFSLASAIIQNHLVESAVVSLVVFIILLICWNFGWLGGGDVKLISVAVIGLAPGAVVTFVAAVSLFGGVLAVAYGIGRKIIRPPRNSVPVTRFSRVLRVECWRIQRGGPLPYVCAIFAGYLYSVF